MADKKEFENALNLADEEVTPSEVEIIDDRHILESDDLEKDFQSARTNMYDLIDAGRDLLDNSIRLAKMSDEARPYEVAGDILAKLIQAQKDLVEIHQRKTAATKDDGEKRSSISVQGNAIFAGSTTDLQKFLEKRRKDA